MLDMLNKKLAEVREGKANAKKMIAAAERQREQGVAQLNAYAGSETTLLNLIEEITAKDKAEEVTADEKVQD